MSCLKRLYAKVHQILDLLQLADLDRTYKCNLGDRHGDYEWLRTSESQAISDISDQINEQGLNPLPTLDWSYVNAGGLAPLITPWWATLSIFSQSNSPPQCPT